MICRHCGKECPEGTKFCIFCGGVLDDPDRKFMGKLFDTVEECNTVKHDYQMLTQNFKMSDVPHTMEEIESAMRECRESSNHPIAIQLAISFLEGIAEDIRYKEKKQIGKIRVLVCLYIAFTLLLMCTGSVIRVGGNWYTLPGMFTLLIPGNLGLITWLWNAFATIVVSFSIVITIYLCFTRRSNEWASSAPFIIPFLFILLFILTIIPSLFFKVNYNYGESFFVPIVAGFIFGLVCTVLLPDKPKKADHTSIKIGDK